MDKTNKNSPFLSKSYQKFVKSLGGLLEKDVILSSLVDIPSIENRLKELKQLKAFKSDTKTIDKALTESSKVVFE